MEDYFPESDFTNAQPACTKNDMNEESLTRFNIARHMAGVPFVVNSAFRSVQH
jgi:hypothetical protein